MTTLKENIKLNCHSCDLQSEKKLRTINLRKNNDFNELFDCCNKCYKKLKKDFVRMKLTGYFDTVELFEFDSEEIICLQL